MISLWLLHIHIDTYRKSSGYLTDNKKSFQDVYIHFIHALSVYNPIMHLKWNSNPSLVLDIGDRPQDEYPLQL